MKKEWVQSTMGYTEDDPRLCFLSSMPLVSDLKYWPLGLILGIPWSHRSRFISLLRVLLFEEGFIYLYIISMPNHTACIHNDNSIPGFQYFSSIPVHVLHYLQGVLFFLLKFEQFSWISYTALF
jgi:hypothetical protein